MCGYVCKDPTKSLVRSNNSWSPVEKWKCIYSGQTSKNTNQNVYHYVYFEFLCFQSVMLCTMKVLMSSALFIHDVENANCSLVIYCLTVQSNGSFAVAVTFTMGSEQTWTPISSCIINSNFSSCSASLEYSWTILSKRWNRSSWSPVIFSVETWWHPLRNALCFPSY